MGYSPWSRKEADMTERLSCNIQLTILKDVIQKHLVRSQCLFRKETTDP